VKSVVVIVVATAAVTVVTASIYSKLAASRIAPSQPNDRSDPAAAGMVAAAGAAAGAVGESAGFGVGVGFGFDSVEEAARESE